jgi:hypothetical protein
MVFHHIWACHHDETINLDMTMSLSTFAPWLSLSSQYHSSWYQHQYGQANSWFLISFLFWLDILSFHFNIYLHNSISLDIFLLFTTWSTLMHSEFPSLCSHNQINYWDYLISNIMSPLLLEFFLTFLYLCIHDSFFSNLSAPISYQSLHVHAKQATIVTQPCSFLCLILPLTNMLASSFEQYREFDMMISNETYSN